MAKWTGKTVRGSGQGSRRKRRGRRSLWIGWNTGIGRGWRRTPEGRTYWDETGRTNAMTHRSRWKDRTRGGPRTSPRHRGDGNPQWLTPFARFARMLGLRW